MSDEKYYRRFSFHCRVLHWCGFWPYDEDNYLTQGPYRVYRFVWYTILSTVFIGQCVDLVLCLDDIGKVNHNLLATTAFFLSLTRGTLTAAKAPVMGPVLKDYLNYLKTETDPKYRAILTKYSNNMNKLNYYYYVNAYALTFVWLSIPIMLKTTEQWELPVKAWIPFDVRSKWIYSFTYFWLFTANAIAVTVLFATDLMFWGVFVQLLAFYDVLISKIERIRDSYEVNHYNRRENERQTIASLKEVVQFHSQLIKRIESVDYALNSNISIQLIIAICTIMIVAFNLFVQAKVELSLPSKSTKRTQPSLGRVGKVLQREALSTASAYLLYLNVQVAEVGIYCLLATTLTTKSNGVVDAIYDIPWFQMESEARYYVSFILMRAKKPPKIHFCIIMELGNVLFLELLHAAYSLLLLLQQLTTNE